MVVVPSVIATTTRQGLDMKRLFKNYRFASGCVAMALSMGLSPAARAEEHGKLRVPASSAHPAAERHRRDRLYGS